MMLEFSTEFNENLIGNDFDRKGKGWVGRKFKQNAHNESWKTKKKYKKLKEITRTSFISFMKYWNIHKENILKI